MAQTKSEVFTTPKGKLIYPHVIAPDTKFSPEGIYDTKISLEPSDARESLLAEIDRLYAESIETAQKDNPRAKQIKHADLPFVNETDDDGNPTGNVILHAKLKAVGKDGDRTWAQSPAVFDSLGNPIKDTKINPWSGTVARISFHIVPFYTALIGAGVSLRLKAVQIITLVSGGERSAKDFGFEEEPEGFIQESFIQPESQTVANAGFYAKPEEDDDLPF